MNKIYSSRVAGFLAGKISGKALAKKLGLFVVASVLFGGAVSSQTNYYLRTDSLNPTTGALVRPNVTNVRAWTTDPLGKSGSPIPKNFTADNQIFHVQTNGYTNNNNLTITGVGSKLVVGNPDSTILFTSGGNSNLTATVDVLDKATLNLQLAKTSGITFGNLATGSTVRFSGNNVGTSQMVIAANYYNLSLQTGGNAYLPVTLPAATIGVAGTLTTRVSNILGSTINFNGTGGQVIPAGTYYNLLVSGNKTIADTVKGTINIVNTFTWAATGTQPAPFVSTINYVGKTPQSINNGAFWNLGFTNGRAYNIGAFSNANKTITLYTKDDLSVGDKVSPSPLNNPIVLDTNTVITSITNDTIIGLSSAPVFRVFVNKPGHATGASPDTIYVTEFSAIDKSITLAAGSSVAVGDTLNAQFIPTRTLVTAVAGSVATLSVALVNIYNLGVAFFGSPNGKPTDKTITGTVAILGAFNAGTGVVNTTGSSIYYSGIRQNVAGITYDNLIINQDQGTTANLSASALVKGNFALQSGKLNTANNRLLTLDFSANFLPPSNDTFIVTGPLAKNFNSTNSFNYYIGAIKNNIAYARTASVKPTTADAKTIAISWAFAKTPNPANFDSVNLLEIDTASYFTTAVRNYATGADTSALFTFQYRFDSVITANNLGLAHYVANKYSIRGTKAIAGSGPTVTFGTITTDAPVSTYGRYVFAFAKPGVLPVKYSSVAAKVLENKTVTVSWNVATEDNVAKYIVESAASLASEFKAKGSVEVSGTKSYSFVDVAPVDGINYYRIKALDRDGKVSYSTVVSVNINKTKTELLSVYPNPVVGKKLNIAINSNSLVAYTLQVTNALGKTIVAKTISHTGGSAAYSLELPASATAGTYFVKLSNGNEQVVKTITVK